MPVTQVPFLKPIKRNGKQERIVSAAYNFVGDTSVLYSNIPNYPSIKGSIYNIVMSQVAGVVHNLSMLSMFFTAEFVGLDSATDIFVDGALDFFNQSTGVFNRISPLIAPQINAVVPANTNAYPTVSGCIPILLNEDSVLTIIKELANYDGTSPGTKGSLNLTLCSWKAEPFINTGFGTVSSFS